MIHVFYLMAQADLSVEENISHSNIETKAKLPKSKKVEL